jgi:hypothetical protein
MPLESVTNISDLNASWPLGGDTKNNGDDHIRNLKTAVRSLLTNVAQLGLTTVEQTLTVASTQITFSGVLQRGSVVIVILTQDGTGGRLITWDATKFDAGTPTDLNLDPNAVTIFAFIGNSTPKLYLFAQR